MNKTMIHYCTGALVIAFAFTIRIAQAQEPADHNGNSAEWRVTNLLAKVQRRAGFTLMLESTPANAGGTAFTISPMAGGPNLPVLGGGTLGRLTKWAGLTSSNSFIGDTTIFEDKR